MMIPWPKLWLAMLVCPAPALLHEHYSGVKRDSAIASVLGARAEHFALRFGTAVAIAGDEILIGRPGLTARRGALGGGVHVFRRDRQGVWREAAVLASDRSLPDEDFGAALAVDGPLLAVGAPRADGGRGAVYLFERLPTGRWIARAKVAAATSAAGDHFGRVVALHDGLLLAGAPDRAHERGAVAVFRRDATASLWTEQAMLTSADTLVRGMGRALAFIAGRIVVGAPGPVPAVGFGVPTPPAFAAQVLIFRDSAETWVSEMRLPSPDTAPSTQSVRSQFGVALLADGTELWISDPAARDGGVFRFRSEAPGRWKEVGRISAPSGVSQFGIPLVRAGQDRLVGGSNGMIVVFRYDVTAADWMEAQRLSLADSGTTSPRFEDKPAWFTGTPALAVSESLAVVGLEWLDVFEGAGLMLERDRVLGKWRTHGAVVDTAWTTRQALTGSIRPCRQGRVGIFRCRDIDLLAFLPRGAIGGSGRGVVLTGVWGWTDSVTSREFVLVGHTDGTAFVEVTDPFAPVYLGYLPLPPGGEPSEWRDMKVYRHHAFIVSEGAGAHGMQVFDLTQLRAVQYPPVEFQETAHYDHIANAHTIVADERTGFMYAAGGNGGGETCGGGLHMIDVHIPTTPTFAGCYTEPSAGGGYVHDAQCVVYHGPDRSYQGREICLASTGDGLALADVTDKAHAKTVSIARYPNIGYTHQGWFTEEQRFFFLDDELDEFGASDTVRTRTMVFDMADLDDPVLVAEFHGPTGATDHNLYIQGHLVYESNYTAGLRVLDAQDPRHPKEVGYFDTALAFDDSLHPGSPRMSQGTWSNYPYLASGAVAVTSMSEGLFLVRYRHRGPR